MTAGEFYTVTLERHERQGPRRLAVLAWVAVSVASFGTLEGPSVGQYVVRRRSDGLEVLRVEAGADEEAAATRAGLDEQLATLSVEEFHEAWSIAA